MTAKILLVSVGGAPGPVIYSIRQNRPDKIVFFVSRGSRNLVCERILPEILKSDPARLLDHEFIVTPDEQDVGACVFELMKGVPAALDRLGSPDAVWANCVDYTGGTKAMSAAVIWASSRFPCNMSYVGTPAADGRGKGGLGVVIDGQERCFLQENPWNRIAYVEARSAIEIFNRGQYGNAAAIMKSLADRVTEDLTSRLFSSLSEVFEGFYQWDIFNHQRAKNILHKNINTLCLLADGQQVLFPELREFSASVKELVETLDGISDGRQGLALVYDLLANAKRRADLEKKYEDATARCYSAIEKSAHYDLSHNCGIDAGNAKPEAIPDKYREEYRRRYEITVREPGRQVVRRIQFGLAATMELLRHYERPIGLRFTERKKLIKEHLAERNKSILAHGSQPISYQRYRDLFEDALYLLKIDESDLTQFPQL